MKNIFFLLFFSSLFSLKAQEILPFTTDGCSLFPDGGIDLNDRFEWRHCCIAHDLEYWAGGTKKERIFADKRLKVCVNEALENSNRYSVFSLGHLMYIGVRIGGAPKYFSFKSPTSFRWGYGLRPKATYEALQVSTLQRALIHLKNFQDILSTDFAEKKWKLKEDQISFLYHYVEEKILRIERNL